MKALARKETAIAKTKAVREDYTFNGHDGTPRTGTTVRSVPDGRIEGTVELQIDVDALFARMAGAALKSKGGKCVAAGGCVRVVVVSRHHVAEPVAQ